VSFLKNLFGGTQRTKTEAFGPLPIPSDEAISLAEAALKIKFPSSFVSFLRSSIAMQVPVCAHFYWVGEESLGSNNIIIANRREREQLSSPLPDFLVAFYNDGMGNQVCFDTRRHSEQGEYPIVFWDHEISSDENLAHSNHAANNHESAGITASSFPQWLKLQSALR
jgi:hypothetical protein